MLKVAKTKNYLTKRTNLAFKETDVQHNSPFGCVNGLKNSLDKNYHHLIHGLGGTIKSNSKIIKIIPYGNIIKDIIVQNTNTNEIKRIKVKNLILSAGPTQTPKIILNNKL